MCVQASDHVGRSKQLYQYYICGTYKNPGKYPEGKCGLGYFNAFDVDRELWKWVCDVSNDPRGLAVKLEESKTSLDTYTQNIRAKLAANEETRRKHYNRIDMFATMYTPEQVTNNPEIKAMLARLTAEVQTVLSDLARDDQELKEKLSESTATHEYLRHWEENAGKIRGAMEEFTFEERLASIQSLNITGTLAMEGKDRVLYVHLYKHTDRIVLSTENGSGKSSGAT